MRDCARRRAAIPPPFDNPPTIGPEFNLFVWAFEELNREREPSTITKQPKGIHVAVHRISYKAIREWADFRQLAHDGELMEELYALVRALDTVWVEVETKRLQRQSR